MIGRSTAQSCNLLPASVKLESEIFFRESSFQSFQDTPEVVLMLVHVNYSHSIPWRANFWNLKSRFPEARQLVTMTSASLLLTHDIARPHHRRAFPFLCLRVHLLSRYGLVMVANELSGGRE